MNTYSFNLPGASGPQQELERNFGALVPGDFGMAGAFELLRDSVFALDVAGISH